MDTKEKIEFVEKDRQILAVEAIERLKNMLYDEEIEKIEKQLWKTLLLFEDYPFQTAKGLEFFYKIRGNEVFFSRKEKSVTRASVNIALKKAIELQRAGMVIKGPKMLKSFGASYIYPVFMEIGVITKGTVE